MNTSVINTSVEVEVKKQYFIKHGQDFLAIH